MDALVSGIAARVVFIDGNDVSYIEADQPNNRIATSFAAIPHLLGGAHDIARLTRTSNEQAFRLLLAKWNYDRALRMFEVLADESEDIALRREASECLDKLLEDPSTVESLENAIYADVLFSFHEEELFALTVKSLRTRALIQRYSAHEDAILRFREAWDLLPDSMFMDEPRRKAFEFSAIHAGAFKKLAQSTESSDQINSVIFDCYFLLKDEPNSRQIIQAWTKQLSTKRTRKILRKFETLTDEDSASHEYEDRSRPEESHLTFKAVRRAQEGIRAQLEKGDIPLARRFADQLIKRQIGGGGSEYAAKSLCSLAQDAKRLGQHSLQLEWTVQATQIAPRDGWAFGQAGDAYLAFYRLEDARKMYELAGKLGDEQFALTGIARVLRASGRLDEALQAYQTALDKFPKHREVWRAWAGYAEVLREMWRLEEALRIYDESAQRFPDEDSLWCGRAAVLKDIGALVPSRDAYSTIISTFPQCAVAHGGYADILKTMGELDAALRSYDAAIESFPNEPVLAIGRAEVLASMGRFNEAIAAFERAMKRFPNEPYVFSGYAEALRDSGRLDESLQVYTDANERFDSQVRLRTGQANILRVMGLFEESLQQYDRNVKDFPYDLYSLAGRANLLKELGQYNDALAAYETIIARRPDYVSARYAKAAILVVLNRFNEAEELLPKLHPNTRSDWVGYHIKGMIELKRDHLESALNIFTTGILMNPFYKERKYFENAAAATKIRMKRFDEVVKFADRADGPIAQILRFHSCAETGHRDEAELALALIDDRQPAPIIDLRNELAARYNFVQAKPKFDEKWILEKETEVLLQAA